MITYTSYVVNLFLESPVSRGVFNSARYQDTLIKFMYACISISPAYGENLLFGCLIKTGNYQFTALIG